jgi:hypothetical protein
MPVFLRALAVLTVIIALGAAAACQHDPVGVRCDLGTAIRTDDVSLASNSLDCTSRLCLAAGRPGGGDDGADVRTGMCTDACASDDDCPRDPRSPCTSGFACAPVMRTTTFACTPMCVCRDQLDPDTVEYCKTR